MLVAVPIGTVSAAQKSVRPSHSEVLVTGRAEAHPSSRRVSHQMPTGGLELVANLSRFSSPNWTMASIFSNQRMGNFVKNNLLDFLQAAIFNQVPTHSYSLGSEVTLTGAIYCSIKAKRIVNDAVLYEKFSRQINGLLVGSFVLQLKSHLNLQNGSHAPNCLCNSWLTGREVETNEV